MDLLKTRNLNHSKFLLCLALILATSSCTKDKGKKLETAQSTNQAVNSSNCDTITFTYDAKIKVIINDNCGGCHYSSSPNGYLLDYSSLKVKALSGSLKGSLNGSGYSLMPPSGKLSNCDIKGIENWIAKGSPNN
jgi:hypothetical protein